MSDTAVSDTAVSDTAVSDTAVSSRHRVRRGLDPSVWRRSAFALCVPLLVAATGCSQTTNAGPTAAPAASGDATEPTFATGLTIDTTPESTTTSSTTTTSTTTTTTLPPNVEVIGPSPVPLAAVGTADGEETKKIQERLTALGFWLGDIDGLYGKATSQAVMAFQKYAGLEATAEVDAATALAMQTMTERGRATADNGTLVEVDKTRQLLFLVVDGKTLWTFNTSTGSEVPYEAVDEDQPWTVYRGDSVTPSGLWQVDRQRADGWWDGDLGKIYRPKYFKGGVAIHGMTSIPNYPASHGCVRVSVPAMDFIWSLDIVNLGTIIWVHGKFPTA
ncbi:MAG: L,D-transpeptidase family protein [Ilumatobacteraceae bacterium]